MNYGFSKVISGDFNSVLEKTTQALAGAGFGIITEIDFQATLKNKLDIDRKPYKILGACNPKLANEAVNTEADMGLLLPCNVVVREQDDNSIVVSFLDPMAMFSLVGRDEVEPMAIEVKRLLQVAFDAIN